MPLLSCMVTGANDCIWLGIGSPLDAPAAHTVTYGTIACRNFVDDVSSVRSYGLSSTGGLDCRAGQQWAIQSNAAGV